MGTGYLSRFYYYYYYFRHPFFVNINPLREWTFSQRCCWFSKSSGMWRSDTGIRSFEGSYAFGTKGNQPSDCLTLNTGSLRSFETTRTPRHYVTSKLFNSSLATSSSLNTESAGSYNEFCESYLKFQFIILTSHLPSINDVHQTWGLTLRLKQAWCILLAQ